MQIKNFLRRNKQFFRFLEFSRFFILTMMSDLKEIKTFFHHNKKSLNAEHLEKKGYVTIPDFLDKKICCQLADKIMKIIKEPEKHDIDIRNYYSKNDAYDTGFMDINNVHLIDPIFKEAVNIEKIEEILKEINKNIYLRHVNAYYTNSLENPRGFHVDSPHIKAYKGFVYLTDVSDDNEPYSFIEKTHRFCFLRYINLIYNLFNGYLLTDMRIHDSKKIIKFIAPKGTLIISSQDGMHRGFPQKKGYSRIMLVYNFIGS